LSNFNTYIYKYLIRILPSNFLPNSFFSREQEFTSSDLVVHGTKRMLYSFLGINTTNISIYRTISSQHHDKKRENTISITVIWIPNISSISHWDGGLYHVDIFKTYSYYPWVERNIIFDHSYFIIDLFTINSKVKGLYRMLRWWKIPP